MLNIHTQSTTPLSAVWSQDSSSTLSSKVTKLHTMSDAEAKGPSFFKIFLDKDCRAKTMVMP